MGMEIGLKLGNGMAAGSIMFLMSVRLFACLSQRGPTTANPLLQVCCCWPGSQGMSIDCCLVRSSSGVWRANAGSATLPAYVGS